MNKMEHTLNAVVQQSKSSKDKGNTKSNNENNNNNLATRSTTTTTTREDTSLISPSSPTPLTVTFIPTADGELKEIPGLGQVLETRSAQARQKQNKVLKIFCCTLYHSFCTNFYLKSKTS